MTIYGDMYAPFCNVLASETGAAGRWKVLESRELGVNKNKTRYASNRNIQMNAIWLTIFGIQRHRIGFFIPAYIL